MNVSSHAVFWVFVRLILGLLQLTGATTALIFLLETGPSSLAVATVALTGAVTVASRLLFRKRREPNT